MSKIPEHLRAAADAGYDAGFNGVSFRNCHYGLFATPDHTQAWEDAKQKGEADRILVDSGRPPEYKQP